jgi:hypothetical protein
LDVKVFHSVHKKKDLDKLHSQAIIDWENIPELNEDDSDYILAASSDSDISIWVEDDDWSYFGSETVPPNQFIQHLYPLTLPLQQLIVV